MNKFYLWLVSYLGILAAHLIVGFYFGAFAYIWTLHHWFIFPILALVFFITSGHLGWVLYQTEKADLFADKYEYLQQVPFSWHWFGYTSEFEIGLLGTVIGSAYAIIGGFSAASTGSLAAIAVPLGLGMGTALMCTATGLVYAWMIKATITFFFDEKEIA